MGFYVVIVAVGRLFQGCIEGVGESSLIGTEGKRGAFCFGNQANGSSIYAFIGGCHEYCKFIEVSKKYRGGIYGSSGATGDEREWVRKG